MRIWKQCFRKIRWIMISKEDWLIGSLNINVINLNKQLLVPIWNLLKGQPHAAMWFMFKIIYGILVTYTCKLSWILQFAEWIGYFMLGNVIRELSIELKQAKKYTILQRTAAILIGLPYIAIFVYWFSDTYKTREVSVPGSFSSLVIVGSIIQFIGFSLLNVKILGRIVKWFPMGALIPVYTLFITLLCIMVAYRKEIHESNRLQ